MKRSKSVAKRYSHGDEPVNPAIENTGSLLIRVEKSMKQFDAQLERSRKIAKEVRAELAGKREV